MKHKIAIVLFLILIVPGIWTLYLLETGQFEKAVLHISVGLAIFIGLLIPLSHGLAYFIVLRDIRGMNMFCQKIRQGKYDFFFDLPNEEEDESEMTTLKRNMNWMLRVISNRSGVLHSKLFESEKIKEQLENLSLKDPLTCLYNRRGFNRKLRAFAENASQSGTMTFFLLLIDVDRFKQINDRFGHQIGDEVLTRLAGILIGSVREGIDIPFRFGGDEFGVIIAESDGTKVVKIAERIRRRYEQRAVGDSSLSIGVAGFVCGTGSMENNVQGLVRAADEAVYQSKNAGGNKVVYHAGVHEHVRNHSENHSEATWQRSGKESEVTGASARIQ